MRWIHVLTGFSGRIRRRDFWIGLLWLLLIQIALFFGFAGLMRPTGPTQLERAVMWLALAILVWVSAALIIKRLSTIAASRRSGTRCSDLHRRFVTSSA